MTSPTKEKTSLNNLLFIALLAVVWCAGGASKLDVIGQTVVRGCSTIIIVIIILTGVPTKNNALRPVGIFVAASFLIPMLQLVPLPPAIWQLLPGRSMLLEAANIAHVDQPWRPISMVPSATVNSLASGLVPVAVFGLMATSSVWMQRLLPAVLIAGALASVFVQVLQLSTGTLVNPLTDGSAAELTGNFANRNHLALFLAIACLLTTSSVISMPFRRDWAVIGLTLVLVFTSAILVTGSRAGLALGTFAILLGFLIGARVGVLSGNLQRRWAIIASLGTLTVIIALVWATVLSGRAVSIDRALQLNAGSGLRVEALPTVWSMVHTYFPFGIGFGGFERVYQFHEPDALLALTYLNQAHNDWLQIVVEGGAAGMAMAAGAVIWWARASVRAWRDAAAGGDRLPLCGGAILLLVMIASAFDYPARTPFIITIIVVAACWLASRPALSLRDAAFKHQPTF